MEYPSKYDLQRCIAECLDCYNVCTQTALNQCLQESSDRVQPELFQLMATCANICRTAADLMLGNFGLHTQKACAVCAEVCSACADGCERVGELDDCAEACRRCADACRDIAERAEPRMEPRTDAFRQPSFETPLAHP